jgi:hypothetical protein
VHAWRHRVHARSLRCTAHTLRLAQRPAGEHFPRVRTLGYDMMLVAIDIAQADTAEGNLMITPTSQ